MTTQTVEAPRGVAALAALLATTDPTPALLGRLGVTPAASTTAQCFGTPATRLEVRDTSAAKDMEAGQRGLELWAEFLRCIDESVEPDTDLVHANDIRDAANPEVNGLVVPVCNTVDEKRQWAGFYSSARATGIMRRVGDEPSTDHAGGNAHGRASIDLVDRRALKAAREDLLAHCPKTLRPKQASTKRKATVASPSKPTVTLAVAVAPAATNLDDAYVPPAGIWDRAPEDDGGLF